MDNSSMRTKPEVKFSWVTNLWKFDVKKQKCELSFLEYLELVACS